MYSVIFPVLHTYTINNVSKCWHSNKQKWREPFGYHVHKHVWFVYSFLFYIDWKSKEVVKDRTSQCKKAELNLKESSTLDLLNFCWTIISLFLMKESQVSPYLLYDSQVAEFNSNYWPFRDIKGPVLKTKFTKSLMPATHADALKHIIILKTECGICTEKNKNQCSFPSFFNISSVSVLFVDVLQVWKFKPSGIRWSLLYENS